MVCKLNFDKAVKKIKCRAAELTGNADRDVNWNDHVGKTVKKYSLARSIKIKKYQYPLSIVS